MGQLTNTWTGPVVGTAPNQEKDGSGMTTADNLTGWPNDMTKPGRMLVGDQFQWPEEGTQVPDPSGMTPNEWTGPVVGTGANQEKDGSGMINADDHAMNTDEWPVEGDATTGAIDGSVQVPDSSGMDTWADNPIDPHEHDIHQQAIDAAGMPRQPDDLNASFVSQQRVQALAGEYLGLDTGPAPRFIQPAAGEVDLHRRAVEIANGFQMPIQYSMKFKCPQGINQPKIQTSTTMTDTTNNSGVTAMESGITFGAVKQNHWVDGGGIGTKGYVEQGGLDWQSQLMNNSVNGQGGGVEGMIHHLYQNASQASVTLWDPQRGKGKRERKMETILNLFCSKVSMPEKSVNFQSMRHYGTHFAYPQSVSYGTMSTSFYCDASMHIKKFFDAWQKLIFNDITGNFNYYVEYTSEFDIFTRSVVGAAAAADEQKTNAFERAQDTFKGWMDEIDALSGMNTTGGPHRTYSGYKYPKMEFRNTYGVKVMECWPQIVGSVDLGHASTNSIAEFTVTWAYKKWNTFNLGEIGKRGQVNLSNSVLHEKGDGIPFVQDMPQELRGPLTQAADQNIMSKRMQRGFAITG